MKILLKEQIENYRYAVAKVVFLLVEKQYKLLNDIPNTNLLEVIDERTGKLITVSMLSLPKPKKFRYPKIKVYDQRKGFDRGEKMHRRDHDNSNNPKGFNKIFNKKMEDAFMRPNSFLKYLKEEEKEIGISNLTKIIEDCFLDKEGFIKFIGDNHPHKYYAYDTVNEGRYGVDKGRLYFSPPKKFNDPFDCNDLIGNNEDMSEKFRILCLTHKYDNILMWSYYAQSHTGFCFRFSYSDLFSKINSEERDGLCIYGKVEYKSIRPSPKNKVEKYSYTDMKFYVAAAFIKYDKWQHEEEVRFVIMSESMKESRIEDKEEEFIGLKADIQRVYVGCSSDKNAIKKAEKRYSKSEVIKLSKDGKAYKLNSDKESKGVDDARAYK